MAIRAVLAVILAAGLSLVAAETRGGDGHYIGGHSDGRTSYGGGHHTYSHGGY
jgi:hypothetical protein